MRIVVFVKQVPASQEVTMDPGTGTLVRDGAAARINPYDLPAIEAALRLRETLGGEVTAVTMGPPAAEGVLREAAAMGADIHWRCEASGIGGNALNAARTPEQAEELLAMGLEIERNLSLRLPCQNPAVTSASRNEPEMMRYWLQKQSQLFAGEPEYLQQLFYAAIRVASMLNQYNTLAVIMADDRLFPLLKEIYAGEDTADSIKLYQSALRRIKDEGLEPRKKELRKILNARKKELSQ